MRRQGFTLVEMMVSLTLVLFIMVILSQAFQAGLETFRLLKGVGDMDERLRSVATILRRDLTADHFEGKRRISDASFWTLGPPREGFFRVWHGTSYVDPRNPPPPAILPPSDWRNFIDGRDGDGIPTTRATDHIMHFSVKLRGNKPQDFVSAKVPTQMLQTPSTFFNFAPDARYQTGPDYSSQWFEVMYCLRQTGTTVVPDSPAGGPGTPLYVLIRRQLVVVPDNTQLNWGPTAQQFRVSNASQLSQYAEVSCQKKTNSLSPNALLFPQDVGDPLHFNNPTDLTIPARRFGMVPSLPTQGGQLASQRERAGLPSVPLIDPNVPGAALNRGRNCPILGEMIYQNKKYGPSGLPAWLNSWLAAGGLFGGIFLDPFTNQALPPVWHDNPIMQGADVLLSDVVSFEVKVLTPSRHVQNPNHDPLNPYLSLPANEFVDLFDSTLIDKTGLSLHKNAVFTGPSAPRVFDTWSSLKDDTYDYSSWAISGSPVSAPMPNVQIQALQITIRVWDKRTQQTRQITLVQDM
jgi:prepilin-type N-terminal cleavage/methylation domain-containing protein